MLNFNFGKVESTNIIIYLITSYARLLIVQMRVTLVLIHQRTGMVGEIHVYGITWTTVNAYN
jgi:hypothetical protein